VPSGGGGLDGPTGLLFGPDGHLYVASYYNHSVMRYDGATGAPLPAPGQDGAVFVPEESGELYYPHDLKFQPSTKYLCVTSKGTSSVLRYDPKTGAFIDTFIPPGRGGLGEPVGLLFGGDGYLYVASNATPGVVRYGAARGRALGVFTSPDMLGPTYLVLMPTVR
jgi:DNA-binding beta-propeller fold protein YncE